jgi:hypothetical protein
MRSQVTMVSAPNRIWFRNWLRRTGHSPAEYLWIKDEFALLGWRGPVIILDGGAIDPALSEAIHACVQTGSTLTYVNT